MSTEVSDESYHDNITTEIWPSGFAGSNFRNEPKMMEDLINIATLQGHTLISVSVGYFIYDISDMLIYQRSRQTLELLLHHFVIVVCFGIAIVTKVYVGYGVLALVVELNSIFLHTRQLLQCCGYTRTDRIYRLNSLVNLGTFLGFRILTLAWMTRWIVINKDLVPLPFYTVGSLGLATMTVMNIILFYRLLKSDFLRQKESHKKED
ncbi:TLC domain-containing protein 2-like isoform X2 [Dreissena polymorpha]|uniref:TLC domain-containing protein 2-like isoform X2 n=1 Tax=Dreissena polymorpha TaxID=45954 RepID=UPI002263C67B|nr:TLC domain-containing protein 2-like isoform X2 [Dreissena polymorpha]